MEELGHLEALNDEAHAPQDPDVGQFNILVALGVGRVQKFRVVDELSGTFDLSLLFLLLAL